MMMLSGRQLQDQMTFYAASIHMRKAVLQGVLEDDQHTIWGSLLLFTILLMLQKRELTWGVEDLHCYIARQLNILLALYSHGKASLFACGPCSELYLVSQMRLESICACHTLQITNMH